MSIEERDDYKYFKQLQIRVDDGFSKLLESVKQDNKLIN